MLGCTMGYSEYSSTVCYGICGSLMDGIQIQALRFHRRCKSPPACHYMWKHREVQFQCLFLSDSPLTHSKIQQEKKITEITHLGIFKYNDGRVRIHIFFNGTCHVCIIYWHIPHQAVFLNNIFSNQAYINKIPELGLSNVLILPNEKCCQDFLSVCTFCCLWGLADKRTSICIRMRK